MSIGDTLAEARRQSGLTITQVSQQTRIRETIIRAIEQGDFTPCGGDFYARGHIRSIASVVGTDPVPLIREYDEEHGPPGSVRAAEIFEPVTPIRIREPRRFGSGKVLAAALLAVIGAGSYFLVSAHGNHPSATQASTLRPAATPTPPPHPVTHASTPPAVARHHGPPESVIKLTAVQDVWVGMKNTSGRYIYAGLVTAGKTVTWHEKKPVSMVIGNPPGTRLTVNGKPQKLKTVTVTTVTIRPSGKNPVTVG